MYLAGSASGNFEEDDEDNTISLGPFGSVPLPLFYAVCVGGVATVVILLLFVISATVFL